jgi:hypothetical protein
MENEQTLTGEQSLELITSMINQAKNDYYDTGISAIILCSMVTYLNHYLKWAALDYVWWLTVIAVVPQIIIAIREGKNRRYKSYQSELISGIWISFAIAIFLFSYISSRYVIDHEAAIFLTFYGIPTFATGLGRRFRPMIFGGLACWAFAIVSLYVPYPNALFLLAGGALLAWFIPGLILRRCYLKAKRQHV